MNQEIQTTFLIIGGGIAGVSCAETISFLVPHEQIILLTESSLIKAVTNLVPLGKALTKFDVEEKDYNIMNSDKMTVLVDTLEIINSTNKYIETKNGKLIKYKYICLCTGGRPKIIEENNNLIIGIRDTESVMEFQKRIKSSRKVLLLGNGGIASELAYEAKNIEVDWVIRDNHITSTFVDIGAAEFFQNRLKQKNTNNSKPEKVSAIKRMRYTADENNTNEEHFHGAALGPDWHRKIDISGNIKNLPDSVKIHYNTEIEKIVKTVNEEFPLKVYIRNNEIIFCDFIVSATGVNPNINFECDQTFEIGKDGGICVNDIFETNISGIYAAGDCCFANWSHSEYWFQMRLWTQARQMGAMAGKSIAAKFNDEIIYQDFCFELFGHVTTLFGLQVVLLGNYNGQGLGNDYEILLRITKDTEYIKFVLKDGKLKGAILIGETGLEETCENLILNNIDLTPYGDDILDPNIDIEDYFD